MSVEPIRIMVTGGAVSVLKFQSRATTHDVDFLLDPNVDAAADYRKAFFDAIQTAGDMIQAFRGWMNDDTRIFITYQQRMDLFLESVEQNTLLYEGTNLVAYVGKYEWSLETKLSRISMALDPSNKLDLRLTDIEDCAKIVEILIARNGDGQPLTREYIKGLDFAGYSGNITDKAISAVAEEFENKYGKPGIV